MILKTLQFSKSNNSLGSSTNQAGLAINLKQLGHPTRISRHVSGLVGNQVVPSGDLIANCLVGLVEVQNSLCVKPKISDNLGSQIGLMQLLVPSHPTHNTEQDSRLGGIQAVP